MLQRCAREGLVQTRLAPAMLRRLCSSTWGSLSAAETAAVEQLCECHRNLLKNGSHSEDAMSSACAECLTAIDQASHTFCLEVAPRSYRAGFSANYRALFPDDSRLYRVDVLETSLDWHSEIWVNGERFQHSFEALQNAQNLQRAWFNLGRLLEKWQVEPDEAPTRPSTSRAALVNALTAFDVAWAKFEYSYISELTAIESQARHMVVKAVEYDALLRKGVSGEEARQSERRLVELVGSINSVANVKCKGRDDLGYGILESARRVLDRGDDGRCGAALILAADVVASYEAMRTYLRRAGACIERVDPHLCNNEGLVAHLVDWETSWEVGSRYLKDDALLGALCDIVMEVKAAQAVAPQLVDMFEERDVELFFVLPRIVMLLFAVDPECRRAEMVRNLLPHRFQPSTSSSGAPVVARQSVELEAFSRKATEALAQLGAPNGYRREGAWRFLLQRAVFGARIAEGATPSVVRVTEDLMRDLECWSLELQRNCPQDWNQCSEVLVHCIAGRSSTRASSKFQV